MIFDKLENIGRYANIHPNLKTAVDFIKKTNLKELPIGKTSVDGDKVFVLNIEVDTYDAENAMFEYHKKYADLHIVVDAKEKFYFEYPEFLSNVVKPFTLEEDVALYKRDSVRNYLLPKVGEFLLFFPGEGHLPKYTAKKEKIYKIIFKVEI